MALPIHIHYDRCQLSFEKLIRSLESPRHKYDDDLPFDTVQNELDRFKIWAGSLGARQRPQKRTSLDYRLRDSDFYRNQVVCLLIDLDDTLDKASELLRGDRPPFEDLDLIDEQQSDPESETDLSPSSPQSLPESDADLSAFDKLRLMTKTTSQNDFGASDTKLVASQNAPEKPMREMPQLCTALKDIVRHLYKLSMIIRRPIPADQLSKSASIPVHGFRSFDRQHIAECFPQASQALTERLAKCTTQRRQLLIYNERHHNRLSDPPDQPSDGNDRNVPLDVHPAVLGPESQPVKLSEQTWERTPSAIAKSLLAPSTEATRFVPPETNQASEVQSESGTISSYAFSETGNEKIRIPPRPSDHDGVELEQFLCPFCFHLVEVRNSRAWTKHVFRDLQAYVCTFEDCPQADRMYETRNEWFEHELQHHRREWHCNDPAHLVYQHKVDFETHMRDCHSSQATDAQLPLLSRICERSSLSGLVKCPLCTAEESDEHGFVSRKSSAARPSMTVDVPPEPSTAENEIPLRDLGAVETFKEEDLETIVDWVIHLPEEFDEQHHSLDEYDVEKSPSTPLETHAPPNEVFVQGSALKRHLAQHLERLALFSILPSKHFGDDTESVDTRNAMSHSMSSNKSSQSSDVSTDSSNSESSSGNREHLENILLDPAWDIDKLVMKLLGWLRHCSAHHPLCHPPPTEFCPKRLIDVRNPTGSLRLVSLGASSTPVYACLSFTWGNTDVNCSTRGNLEERMRGIDIKTLPKTIQDAIILAHRLNIPYLWIDALCIIQDDRDDWMAETAVIYEIFHHANITIAASFGEDSDISLFRGRPDSPMHASRYNITPLKSRGWTLQEEYFSRRLLSFENEETTWKCNTEERCECTEPKYIRKPNPSYGEWYHLVEDYSKRSLLYPTHTLIAISSMARKFTEDLGDEYIAGLWRKDLLRGLLWCVAGPVEQPNRCIAPGWSWASAGGPVQFPSSGFDCTYSEVLQANYTTLGGNQFDGIKSGEIVLRGLTMHGIMRVERWGSFLFSAKPKSASLPDFLIVPGESVGAELTFEEASEIVRTSEVEEVKDAFRIPGEKLSARIFFDLSDNDKRGHEKARWVTCLWLGYCSSKFASMGYLGGILLDSCGPEQEERTFRRVGIVFLDGISTENTRDWANSLAEQWQKEEVRII